MQSLTYKDIIDEKIAEWRSGLKKLEEQVEKASSDTQSQTQCRGEATQVSNRYGHSSTSYS